ncbi:enoyl-CoA hydratase/isomerase family protein, partial [Leucobacter albus]
AIIVDAAGRAFCAGGDVQAMAQMSERGGMIRALAERINVGILALTESAKPVVAAAHGTTAGGGLGILLASDYAVVGESSRVGSIYGGVGLTPDLSVSAQLAAAVGERRALQLLLQERLLSAEEAVEWGLAAERVADDQVGARAEAIAAFWVQNAHAYGEAKRLIRSRPERSFREQLSEEASSIARASESPEGDRRIKAFAAR